MQKQYWTLYSCKYTCTPVILRWWAPNIKYRKDEALLNLLGTNYSKMFSSLKDKELVAPQDKDQK